jgi:hypothetical protein
LFLTCSSFIGYQAHLFWLKQFFFYKKILDCFYMTFGSIAFSFDKIYVNFLIAEKENLCLYGFPSEQWEVNLPAEEVPPELPEPALGINFARDGMQEKDWLSLVAVHSDAWLLSVSFYFGSRFGFDKADRYITLEQLVVQL